MTTPKTPAKQATSTTLKQSNGNTEVNGVVIDSGNSPAASEKEVQKVLEANQKGNTEGQAKASEPSAAAAYKAEVKQSEENRQRALDEAEAARKAAEPAVEEVNREESKLAEANAQIRQAVVGGPDSAPKIAGSDKGRYILALADRLEKNVRLAPDPVVAADEIAKELRRLVG